MTPALDAWLPHDMASSTGTIYPIQRLPDTLQALHSARQLIPFVGAGFSRSLGLPSWEGLIDDMATEADFEPALFRAAADGRLEQLAGWYELWHPDGPSEARKRLSTRLHQDFQRPESVTRRRVPSSPHTAFAKLDWHTVYTTNYDEHLEGCLRDAGRGVRVLRDLHDFQSTPRATAACDVVKFHGDFSRPETLVLTEEDYYRRLPLDTAVDQRLRSDLMESAFLFIGYGFRDVNIRYLWSRLSAMRAVLREGAPATEQRSYWVTAGAGLLQPRLLAAWNIDVIELDPTDMSGSVCRLFDWIGGGP